MGIKIFGMQFGTRKYTRNTKKKNPFTIEQLERARVRREEILKKKQQWKKKAEELKEKRLLLEEKELEIDALKLDLQKIKIEADMSDYGAEGAEYEQEHDNIPDPLTQIAAEVIKNVSRNDRRSKERIINVEAEPKGDF